MVACSVYLEWQHVESQGIDAHVHALHLWEDNRILCKGLGHVCRYQSLQMLCILKIMPLAGKQVAPQPSQVGHAVGISDE